MIDLANEVFNTIKVGIESGFPALGVAVVGENVDIPSSFPCVTADEITNVPVHLDSAQRVKYARVVYRVQVFSNLRSGKRAQAREIYRALDGVMVGMGLFAKSYSPLPSGYNSGIYAITATYEGVADEHGVIYRG